MPTWNELREFARTNFTLDPNDEDDWFSLIVATVDGRTQQIVVSHYEAYDREWVGFRTSVCQGSEMSAEVALRHNGRLAMGALVMDSYGDYMLSYQAPLATLDPGEFALPLEVLPSLADELEKAHTAKDDY